MCAAVQRRKKPKELEAEAEVRLNAEIKGNVTRILLDVTDSLFGEHPPWPPLADAPAYISMLSRNCWVRLHATGAAGMGRARHGSIRVILYTLLTSSISWLQRTSRQMWLLRRMPRVATLLLLQRRARSSHQALCCSLVQVLHGCCGVWYRVYVDNTLYGILCS